MERLARCCARILTYLCIAVMLLMMLHVTASVLLRLFTGRDIPLTLEMTAYYYMVALTYLPLAMIDLSRKHIRAEFLASLLPSSLQRPLTILCEVLMLGLLCLLTYQTTLGAIARTKRNDSLITIIGNIPSWPPRWIVPVGLGVAAFAAFAILVRTLRGGAPLPTDIFDMEDKQTEAAAR